MAGCRISLTKELAAAALCLQGKRGKYPSQEEGKVI
jgi:hypothetical protein